MKNITGIYQDCFGQRWGTCQGRRVKWTYAVGLWFFYDTGDYIFNAVEVSQ